MKNKLWVKIVVWILAILMIGSCVSAALISIFAAKVSAAEIEPAYVTVGLMYGSDVTVGFETVSTVGFTVYAATAGKTERFLEEIYTIELPKISVVCDDNLSQSAYTYSIYNGSLKCVVGGYHLEVKEDFDTLEDAEEMLETVIEGLEDEGSDMHPFIAYIDGAYKIRIGDYSSEERIATKKKSIPDLAEEIKMVTAVPSDTCVSIVDPETNTIYFEFDDGGDRMLGLSALPKDGEKQYLKTPANRLYDGAFLYERYKTDSVDGVALTNMLPLEDYIAGVVPYEISPDWPEEALRAFAITVRSYTVQNLNLHYSKYGFDLCNSTHCQVYRGIASANDAVFEAVQSTEGLVLTDGENIITTYYSSSMGGYTAGAQDTWGGEDPYLLPIYTPWERYSEHSKGIWKSEVSGEELADYLRSKGYDEITGKRIVDIEINEYSGDGPYIYSITYTDSKGNELTISRCDKVRISISKYVNSANFVVGKGSVTFEYDEVVDIDVDSLFGTNDGEDVEAEGGYFELTEGYFDLGKGDHMVLTASGLKEEDESRLYVLTADDEVRVREKELMVVTEDSGYYVPQSSGSSSGSGVTLIHHTEVIEAEDEDNFIIAGKGWGHGVGISQYGTYDLAVAGATAEQILALYFSTLMLCDYRELE